MYSVIKKVSREYLGMLNLVTTENLGYILSLKALLK
jgi:hypothetical protein